MKLRENRCIKCNALLFKTSHKDAILEGSASFVIEHKCPKCKTVNGIYVNMGKSERRFEQRMDLVLK